MGSVCTSAVASMLVIALAGCSDSSGPLGSGNRVSMDVDASSQATQSSPPSADAEAPSADSPFAPLDGQGQYGALVDGYAPLAVCAQCACAAEAGTYCYGGSPQSSFSGACDQTGATGTGLAVGCHSFPPGC